MYNLEDKSEFSSSPFAHDCRCCGVTSGSARIRYGAECPPGSVVSSLSMGATRMQLIITNNLKAISLTVPYRIRAGRTDRPTTFLLSYMEGKSKLLIASGDEAYFMTKNAGYYWITRLLFSLQQWKEPFLFSSRNSRPFCISHITTNRLCNITTFLV